MITSSAGKNETIKDERYYQTTILKMFEKLSGKYSVSELFSDYLDRECSAFQAMLGNNIERYKIVRDTLLAKYDKATFEAFDEITNMLRKGLEETSRDILGVVYMKMNPNKRLGQFFTPSHICEVMAKITGNFDEISHAIEEKGYATVADPTCGGGALLIAYYKVAKEEGVDLDKIMFYGKDLDNRCAQMTYLQLQLLNVNALIEHGDTLLVTTINQYITTAAYLKIYGEFSLKLNCLNYLAV